LEVRDTLALALEHVNLEKMEETEDMALLKDQFKNVVKGQEMTCQVMDKVLGKFEVIQFDPKGDKFDPNIHDAVFIMPAAPDEKLEHDTVGEVIQTGWKIGERVLRAAKVGIKKK
jgi:molecular chaperone GrpE